MVFGNLGNMGNMMKQAMEMQKNLKRIKDELKHARYDSEEGGVSVVVNGDMEIQEIKIPTGIDERRLEDTVKKAVNKALKKAKDDAAGKLKNITGGMSIPGLT
ncbi:nucleoid-associated protein, YbaB/EbfC family [candidate division WOR-1 bacterium RIFOXYD2_FULL_36_8]|uniref:Nucleoid-associated protein A2290_00525 n=1 Tax=candidate division WOR-1 bacterium RIFOXYB2_FULL_36_35 TaxID=1802578 RepID=A0A1F4S176_UNCSA|nr:MAG: nucleoid-associated protein, YbaB/EbfC family [candidate division WOR-1 bacterium RIFOXYA2_FULL_36_21]OGC14147.1 MAG: nucleoid-associated protein, YbaB/EbfC family [candidate division WOR-1 bacterium RIFOXYB2_FULL_36_35]OGC15369.1 MAG: nucleoid-associated protein, YbaB/EbfC family [candidate division WOR-1 bacterium RIFOXYA12_FULL_36_13]OGC38639.1 MAG: nucleoid-associated protein, YbaB/EbfC family [candidate division WOR-1 bacterium RIFOXYD2_FULL_36_8]